MVRPHSYFKGSTCADRIPPEKRDSRNVGFGPTRTKRLYNRLMARIWKETYDSAKHQAPIEYWGSVDDHLRAPALIPKDVVMVHVASFTFQFMTVEQLRECLSYFEQKIHPISKRRVPPGSSTGKHEESQRWFERLPMHLLEEPKRLKVVEALSRALKLIDEGKL
jgi:hypothetical protein